MSKVYRFACAALLLVGLCACGGSSGSPSPGPDTLFSPVNAWTGTVPPDTEMLSPNEFRQAVAAGEVVVFGDAALEAQAATAAAQFTQNLTSLNAAGPLSPTLEDLRAELAAHPTPEGDRLAAGPGDVLLLGRSAQLRGAAHTLQLAASVDNALADYSLSVALLPDALQVQLPIPDALRGRPLNEVRQALDTLNALLDAQPAALGTARSEPGTPEARAVGTQALLNPGTGTGRDEQVSCTAPKGLYARYWFPLKKFLSPVKAQGRRGTCWAFTALGAIESRERVQRDVVLNLSEQFLVNKIKEDWDSSTYEDGYNTNEALEEAQDKRQALLTEADWTYNPSLGRPTGATGEAAYANACSGYSGTCSNTAHQSRRVCATVVVTVCGYATVAYRGPGVVAGPPLQVWSTGQPFPLSRLRQFLAHGHVLMASFPVYRGMHDDVQPDGVVSNFADTRLVTVTENGQQVVREVKGNYGGHAALIVGFLSNADLRTPTGTPSIRGGGYFILKNSWGCNAGDGGYYYVPAEYVQARFTSLSVLAFDTVRSEAWRREQTLPGGTDAPVISLRDPPLNADLRVPLDLSAGFLVRHPVARSVELTVTSDREGLLYQGSWSTDPLAIAQPELRRTFGTAGSRTLTVQAAFGTAQAQASFTLNVVNTPPQIWLDAAQYAYQGEPFQVTAVLSDRNEQDAAALCARTTWAVTAPDVIVSAAGCQALVRFGTGGLRIVSATARDAEGQSAGAALSRAVLPPPANPYPRVSGDVATRLRGTLDLCVEQPVPAGATLDFTRRGCALATQEPPTRHLARAFVDNPSGEVLTYDWTLYITDLNGERIRGSLSGRSQTTFDLGTPGNSNPVMNPCRVHLRIRAPEPARDKEITVWTGRCTYFSERLN